MSHDFDLRVIFDLDIGVNAKNIVKPRLATAAPYTDRL